MCARVWRVDHRDREIVSAHAHNFSRERTTTGETRVSIFLGSSGLVLIINVVNYLDYRLRIVNLDCRYDCIYEMCEMYDS